VIELHGVDLQIGGRRIIERIDAQIHAGELVAVLGPNGAGKTTLLRTIAGLNAAAAGTILVGGENVARLRPRERAKRLAFVTGDEPVFDALQVRELVAVGRYPYHRWWQWQANAADAAAIDRALDATQTAPFADRLFSTLSSGERQRVWIALGLAQETPVLLLDEPTTHLDIRVAHEILALLRALALTGKTILCALHDLNDAAAYADRVALLGNGRLQALDAPEAIFAGELLEQTYGIKMSRVRLEDGRPRVFPAID
jgi:ABC-type cobalamin/Fe3+-siderophores transport system ATPase subunit